jgi:hypothetical protein
MQITPDGLGVKTMIGSDVDGRNDDPDVGSLDGDGDGDVDVDDDDDGPGVG